MIFKEIPWRSPVNAFRGFFGAPHAHLFHAGDNASSRWSFIVCDPDQEIRFHRAADSHQGARHVDDPFDRLGEAIADLPRIKEPPAPIAEAPFLTGAVGFIGYEVGGWLEPAVLGPASPFALPDFALHLYSGAVLFDRDERRAFLYFAEADAAERAEARLAASPAPNDAQAGAAILGDLQSNFSAGDYQRAVADVIEKILDGDIFQANIAQSLSVSVDPDSLFEIYQRLAASSDAPFGAVLQYPEGVIISNSPERMFRIEPENERRRIITEPIKGTRPRGATAMEDRSLSEELLASTKDRAENIMIADLIRNDLSRICEDDSITEDAICALQSYASVHHLVSRISGQLRDDIRIGDVFRALFPCGSITGAPKIEAMKTIAAIERRGRGPYCGAVGYVDARGGADFSVAIRTMIVEPGGDAALSTFAVGGGVTLRSDPQAEYEETIVKARSFLKALGAEGVTL